jgi:hypothetical protein
MDIVRRREKFGGDALGDLEPTAIAPLGDRKRPAESVLPNADEIAGPPKQEIRFREPESIVLLLEQLQSRASDSGLQVGDGTRSTRSRAGSAPPARATGATRRDRIARHLRSP